METNSLKTEEAAAKTGLSVSTLEKLRVYGGGPKFCRLGRAVRYRAPDLDAWMAERLVGSTSERVAA